MSDSMMVFGDYVYLDPTEHIFTFEKTQLPEKFQQIQNLSKYGYLLGYVSYEAGLFAEKSLKNMKTPLLEFFFFQKRYPVLEFQQNSLQKQAVFCPKILQNLNETSYAKGFDTIKKNLKKGNTYQVNFTQEIHLQTTCEGMEIFLSLLKQQNTAYKAYLKTPFVEIISFSPELFFQIKNDEIILEPMKGTIKRGSNEEEDEINKKKIQQDSKSISENIMIVDLLRNDISQIAKSLEIESLLSIKTYPTLHQMVSNIKAKIPGCTLYEVFNALFPCGSVTGAPKRSTMEIIQAIERRDRGVYCGAIGVVQKNESMFNVPIRTLMKYEGEDFYRYGVGSGVVWDSKCAEEFLELELKSEFLFLRDFMLLETVLIRQNQAFLLSYHLRRLLKSAKCFGFKVPDFLERRYEFFCKELKVLYPFNPLLVDFGWENLFEELIGATNSPCIMRLLLNREGELKIEYRPYVSNEGVLKITFARDRVYTHNDLLFHKSTLRECFTQSFDGKFFDYIYLNQRDEITEGSRSNLIVYKEGVWVTPPRRSGLLEGCMRQVLLEGGLVEERTLYVEDVLQAQRILCVNSVRGIVEVVFEEKNTSN